MWDHLGSELDVSWDRRRDLRVLSRRPHLDSDASEISLDVPDELEHRGVQLSALYKRHRDHVCISLP